jgi:hypothetical protein
MAQNLFGHNLLKRIPHLLYSPNITPSDFYLFRKVKSALIGREIPDASDCLEAVNEILNGTSDAESQRVFRSWIERVERTIDTGGNHSIREIFPFSLAHSRSLPLWPASSFTGHSISGGHWQGVEWLLGINPRRKRICGRSAPESGQGLQDVWPGRPLMPLKTQAVSRAETEPYLSITAFTAHDICLLVNCTNVEDGRMREN